MSDTIAQTVLPAEDAFVTIDEGKAAIRKLIEEVAPSGGTRFGITKTFLEWGMIAQPNCGGADGWRIAVTVKVPRFATMSCAWLAGYDLPLSRKRIEFVFKADADFSTVKQTDGCTRKQHCYTFLNGAYQPNTEIRQAHKFRDYHMRIWYDSAYATSEFNRALCVLRSELTGEVAFPRPWTARRRRSLVVDWRKGR